MQQSPNQYYANNQVLSTETSNQPLSERYDSPNNPRLSSSPNPFQRKPIKAEVTISDNRGTGVKRGDGIADFMLMKIQFSRCREDVLDVEKRVQSLEELF